MHIVLWHNVNNNQVMLATSAGLLILRKKHTHLRANDRMVFYHKILHLKGYVDPGTTCANAMNFVKNHAPIAGSIARLALPLYHGWPLFLEVFICSRHKKC